MGKFSDLQALIHVVKLEWFSEMFNLYLTWTHEGSSGISRWWALPGIVQEDRLGVEAKATLSTDQRGISHR